MIALTQERVVRFGPKADTNSIFKRSEDWSVEVSGV